MGLVLIAFLFGFFPYLIQNGIISEEFGLNIGSETWGLLFTLMFFVVILELREKLEWRQPNEKILKRIGLQLHGVFQYVSDLCEVNVPFDFEKEDFKKYPEKKLNELLTKEIKLKSSWKKEETSLYHAERFDSLWEALGTIETRHGKFLSPTLQDSLMTIEDSLHSLSFEFHLTDGIEIGRKQSITKAIAEIFKEIDKLRKSGVDVGF